jgi:hypothetical protein
VKSYTADQDVAKYDGIDEFPSGVFGLDSSESSGWVDFTRAWRCRALRIEAVER